MFCLFNFSYQVHFHGPILIYRWGGGGVGVKERDWRILEKFTWSSHKALWYSSCTPLPPLCWSPLRFPGKPCDLPQILRFPPPPAINNWLVLIYSSFLQLCCWGSCRSSHNGPFESLWLLCWYFLWQCAINSRIQYTEFSTIIRKQKEVSTFHLMLNICTIAGDPSLTL